MDPDKRHSTLFTLLKAYFRYAVSGLSDCVFLKHTAGRICPLTKACEKNKNFLLNSITCSQREVDRQCRKG